VIKTATIICGIVAAAAAAADDDEMPKVDHRSLQRQARKKCKIQRSIIVSVFMGCLGHEPLVWDHLCTEFLPTQTFLSFWSKAGWLFKVCVTGAHNSSDKG